MTSVKIDNLSKKRIPNRTYGLDARMFNGKSGMRPTHFMTVYKGRLRRIYHDCWYDGHAKVIKVDNQWLEIDNLLDFLC